MLCLALDILSNADEDARLSSKPQSDVGRCHYGACSKAMSRASVECCGETEKA